MKAVFVCIVAALSMLFLGCEESVSTGVKKPTVAGGSVSKLQEKALEIIYECLSDESSGRMRTHAIEVVSTTGRRDMMPIVVKLLKDEVVPVRFSACVAIGDMKYTGGTFSVKRLLKDADTNVRIAAAYALTKLKKGEFSGQIYEALGSNDQTVQANAVLLLGKLGDRKAISVLKKVAQDSQSGDDIVAVQVAESIATLGGDEDTYQKLWALLMSKYAGNRAMGIRAMGALGTKDAENAILTMLHDETVEIRLLAAEQLGQLGNNIGEKEVLDYLNRISSTLDEQSRLRGDLLAVSAIGHIRSSQLADFLPNFIKSSSKDMQLRAAQSVLYPLGR